MECIRSGDECIRSGDFLFNLKNHNQFAVFSEIDFADTKNQPFSFLICICLY